MNMSNQKYYFLLQKLKTCLWLFYSTLATYLIGFFLFIFSVEVIVIHSTINGIYIYNNVNLVWIFGLIIMFIAFIINIFLFIYVRKTEQLVIKHALKDVQYTNKYLKKWKQKVINHLSTLWYFLNIFNIEVWVRSVSKNLEIVQTANINGNNKKDKLSTIVEDYYAQMHPQDNNKKNNKRK